GVAAIPPAIVVYYRRKVPETPRFSLLVKQNKEEAKKASELVGGELKTDSVKTTLNSFSEFIKSYWKLLLGTALPWFFMDMALYGTGVFSSPITKAILGGSSGLTLDVIRAGIPLLIGVPGYFIAAYTIDKLGRKFIQSMGFLVMALLYFAISVSILTVGTKIVGYRIPDMFAYLMFALTFLFINFGPNTTTFVLPSELYPVKYRTTGHGISAASGKAGAAVTLYLFPILLKLYGLKDIFILLGFMSLLGLFTTLAFIYEPKMKSLEETSKEKIEISKEEREIVVEEQ
ncbi:MAG: MFS transporter, partial [Caldisphaera sp.]|nr:MFS transporter [Caldisphaera sp.]